MSIKAFVLAYQRRAVFDRLAGHLSLPMAEAVAFAMQAVAAGDQRRPIEVHPSLQGGEYFPVGEAGHVYASQIVAWYQEVLGDLGHVD